MDGTILNVIRLLKKQTEARRVFAAKRKFQERAAGMKRKKEEK